MKLFLKDTIFQIHPWNKDTIKENIWYEIDFFNKKYDKDLYKLYSHESINEENNVILAINSNTNDMQYKVFHSLFKNKIIFPCIDEIDLDYKIWSIMQKSYVEISEEDAFYLKLKEIIK